MDILSLLVIIFLFAGIIFCPAPKWFTRFENWILNKCLEAQKIEETKKEIRSVDIGQLNEDFKLGRLEVVQRW